MRKIIKRVNVLSVLSEKELVSTSGGSALQTDEAKGSLQEFLDILKWW